MLSNNRFKITDGFFLVFNFLSIFVRISLDNTKSKNVKHKTASLMQLCMEFCYLKLFILENKNDYNILFHYFSLIGKIIVSLIYYFYDLEQCFSTGVPWAPSKCAANFVLSFILLLLFGEKRRYCLQLVKYSFFLVFQKKI